MTTAIAIHQPLPPAEQALVRRVFGDGLTSNKGIAAAEQVAERTIAHRWERMALRLNLEWGHRSHADIILALVRRRWVEYLMLVLALLIGSGFYQDQDLIRSRQRPARVVRVRPGRRDRHDLTQGDIS